MDFKEAFEPKAIQIGYKTANIGPALCCWCLY